MDIFEESVDKRQKEDNRRKKGNNNEMVSGSIASVAATFSFNFLFQEISLINLLIYLFVCFL